METVKLGDGYVYSDYITLSLKMSTIKVWSTEGGIGWEGGSRGRGQMYTYVWFMSIYRGNQPTIVNKATVLQLKVNKFKNTY